MPNAEIAFKNARLTAEGTLMLQTRGPLVILSLNDTTVRVLHEADSMSGSCLRQVIVKAPWQERCWPIAKIAADTDVPASTLRRWVAQGAVRGYRVGRDWYVNLDDALARAPTD